MIGFFVIVMVWILALVVGLKVFRAYGRGALEEGGVPPQRLDRIETALSTLESRLDDLQDQQRFLERLLAERPERPELPASRESDERPDRGTDSILFDTRPDDEEER